MWDLIVSVPNHCLSFYFLSHYVPSLTKKDNVFCMTDVFEISCRKLEISCSSVCVEYSA